MRFVGIDIASETHVVAVVDEQCEIVERAMAFHEDAVFEFLADDLGHRLSLMISDRGLGRVESRPEG